VIHTPTIKLPMFDQMLSDRPTAILFAVFVVGIGPLCEELAFRGFLMPLLMRSLGTAGGIVLTAVLFGAMHGYEYEWSWRHMLLISIVGIVLGWVRNDTGSTAASTFMHATFNLTQLAAFVAQPK
jgi:membrane protease YdiL (CAAX protease family)